VIAYSIRRTQTALAELGFLMSSSGHSGNLRSKWYSTCVKRDQKTRVIITNLVGSGNGLLNLSRPLPPKPPHEWNQLVILPQMIPQASELCEKNPGHLLSLCGCFKLVQCAQMAFRSPNIRALIRLSEAFTANLCQKLQANSSFHKRFCINLSL